MMKKEFLFTAIVLALIGCGKQPKTEQTAEHNSDRIPTLCEVNNEDIVCSTLKGEKINPLGEIEFYTVIPKSVTNYDEDDYEILSDKDQYIHLEKDETDSLLIQYADIYNALTMMHNLINDMEVTERYETKTFKAISRLNCSIIHNSNWRELMEQMRDAHVKANRTMDKTEQDSAYETMGSLYEVLNVVAAPLMQSTEEAYYAVCNRSTYFDNFAQIDTLRGSGDVNYQKQLLATYTNATDFDRKCIWALEFAHSGKEHASFMGGAALLEEVMLSGIYSPYLDEIWATWRAMVSTPFPMSNFGYIPNLYYNQMRLTCAKTILQHIRNNPNDQLAQAIFINLAGRDNIVRHGFIAGNSSAVEQMYMFPEWEKE